MTFRVPPGVARRRPSEATGYESIRTTWGGLQPGDRFCTGDTILSVTWPPNLEETDFAAKMRERRGEPSRIKVQVQIDYGFDRGIHTPSRFAHEPVTIWRRPLSDGSKNKDPLRNTLRGTEDDQME